MRLRHERIDRKGMEGQQGNGRTGNEMDEYGIMMDGQEWREWAGMDWTDRNGGNDKALSQRSKSVTLEERQQGTDCGDP